MRLLVISDAHGAVSPVERAIESQPEALRVVYLGDGVRQIYHLAELYSALEFTFVRGNCDYSAQDREVALFEFAGKRVFATHGHLYHVKQTLDEAKLAARRAGADVLLFGHTHTPLCGYEDGLTILNPGSAARPRQGAPTYGVLDITPQGIVPLVVKIP